MAPTVDAADVLRNQWISVKDRIPDSDGLYIVTACDEGCSAGEGIWYDTVVVTAEYYNGCWTWYDSGTEYDLDGIVTHWMPMPKKPEEAPAVEAAPVVPGRWVEKEDIVASYLEDCTEVFYECSVCKEPNDRESPYCPNCGVKMEL